MIYGQPITLGGGSDSILPDFTYTGDWEAVQEDETNWKIRFLSSGVLTFKKPQTIDAFLVGAGGGGSSGGRQTGGFGGGGGYTTTGRNISLLANTPYDVVIGAGGSKGVSANCDSRGNGGNGGTTSAFDLTAAGGYGGGVSVTIDGTTYYAGGCGGSGAGTKYASDSPAYVGYPGAFDGNDAYYYSRPDTASAYTRYTMSKGQGTTTREFGESNGKLYAGGGGAGGRYWNTGPGGGGGMGGGGAGHLMFASGNQTQATGFAGEPNSGGGGGAGTGGTTAVANGNGGAGGSGIVVIRNAR